MKKGPAGKEAAVVLLSGGIDSSTALVIAKSEGYSLYAISFDYNQRHLRELESARMVAAAVGVRKHLVVRFDLREIGGSALTSDVKVPKMSAAARGRSPLRAVERIPVTYVPARNTIFLSYALAWAEVLRAGSIFIGANAVDYSGYPDCRPGYLMSFERMANLATKVSAEGDLRFRIRAPLLSMKKADIIRRGTELGLDYSLTWSCYDPRIRRVQRSGSGAYIGKSPSVYVPCGACDSCRFRSKGFREAGLEDPAMQLSAKNTS